MPITTDAKLRKLPQDEFGVIAFEVMRHAFEIHRELGRFFDERIYPAELANRCSGARIEVPIDVSFEGFKKVYFVDLLVEGGAVFEIKTAEGLHDRHRAQLLNYLLLLELAHGNSSISARRRFSTSLSTQRFCDPIARPLRSTTANGRQAT